MKLPTKLAASVAALTLAPALGAALIVGTDGVYKMVNTGYMTQTVDTPTAMEVRTTHEQIKKEADDKSRGGSGNVSASDQELVEIFKSECGVTNEKAYGMLACYKAATEAGLSSYETVGILGCAMAEGCPGLIQYGFSLNGYGTSTKKTPVVVNSTAKADAWINNIVNKRGIGTAQWTDIQSNGKWSYRGKTYVELLKKYLSDSEAGVDTLWKADYEMYKSEFAGSYQSLITDMSKHNSSVESIVVFSMFKYESGWGNYKNSDKISDYSGTFRSYLDARYANALTIDSALRKCSK